MSVLQYGHTHRGKVALLISKQRTYTAMPFSHYSIVRAWTTVPLFIWERWNNVTPKSFPALWVCAQHEILSFGFMQIICHYLHFMAHILFSIQMLVPKKVAHLNRKCNAVLKQQLRCLKCLCVRFGYLRRTVLYSIFLFVCVFDCFCPYFCMCIHFFRRCATVTHTQTNWCLDIQKKEEEIMEP